MGAWTCAADRWPVAANRWAVAADGGTVPANRWAVAGDGHAAAAFGIFPRLHVTNFDVFLGLV